MKARSKRKREAARTFTDGKRRDNPLPLGKLRTDAPKRAPVAKWFNREQVHRGTPKPWFKVPTTQIKPPHRERRIARAIGRFATSIAA